MNTYAIVDVNGNVINIIVWDGVSAWAPPANTQTILISAGTACEIGYVVNGSNMVDSISADDSTDTSDNTSDNSSIT